MAIKLLEIRGQMGHGSPVSVLGASARAAAQSAIRAGLRPWCIDLFADRDLAAVAEVRRCPAAGYPHAMVDMLRDAPDAPALLTGKMEDYPEVLAGIAARRPLLGVTVDAILRARDPLTLRAIKPLPASRRELVKPRRGSGIRLRRPGERIDDEHYTQPLLDGDSIAAVFRGPQLVGVTEQLVSRFVYRGSVGPIDIDTTEIERIGAAVAEQCGIEGLFGIDLIRDRSGQVWPIEINPRYTASMEIVERAGGDVLGKRIVYARDDLVAPDLYDVFARDEIADVPRVGERIARGRPICTVFARGATVEACKAQLRERIERILSPAPL